jgi:hypothetical protein
MLEERCASRVLSGNHLLGREPASARTSKLVPSLRSGQGAAKDTGWFSGEKPDRSWRLQDWCPAPRTSSTPAWPGFGEASSRHERDCAPRDSTGTECLLIELIRQ